MPRNARNEDDAPRIGADQTGDSLPADLDPYSRAPQTDQPYVTETVLTGEVQPGETSAQLAERARQRSDAEQMERDVRDAGVSDRGRELADDIKTETDQAQAKKLATTPRTAKTGDKSAGR